MTENLEDEVSPKTAGAAMTEEFLSVQENDTIGQATDSLRANARKNSPSYVYVVDADGHLCGLLKLRDLIFSDHNALVKDLMDTNPMSVQLDDDQEDIAALFKTHNFLSLPVVDEFHKLRGIVTSADVIEIVEEEATEDMQKMVGLSGEESTETPWLESFRNRLPWLLVNLVTAILAGWVVAIYEPTIAKYAILAVALPIIASQGGNTGIQTLTIIVRALSLEENPFSKWRVLLKETWVALLTGLCTGLIVGLLAYLWKGNMTLSIVACAALTLNAIAGAAAGVVTPLTLKACKVDPALASSIFLTTVTDVVGFALLLQFALIGFALFPPGNL